MSEVCKLHPGSAVCIGNDSPPVSTMEHKQAILQANMKVKTTSNLRSVSQTTSYTCPAQPVAGSFGAPVKLCHLVLDGAMPVCFAAKIVRTIAPNGPSEGYWDCGASCPWYEYFTLPIGPQCGDNSLISGNCALAEPGYIQEFYRYNDGSEFNFSQTDGIYVEGGADWTLDVVSFAPNKAIRHAIVGGIDFITDLSIVCGPSSSYIGYQTPDNHLHLVLTTDDAYICQQLAAL